MKKLSDIKILIWDFDGTLYRPIPGLTRKVREAEYQTIMSHTKWPRERTIIEFNGLHKIVPSATETVATLCHISTVEAAHEGEKYIDRSAYLKRDERLIQLFESLRTFSHYMLVNGIKSVTQQSLNILGLDMGLFKEIITSEAVGENKPSLKGYQYILSKTKLPPKAHLMIGDRAEVDLAPAKQLGMKTCLVWTDREDPAADVVIPTVYEILSLLLFKKV